MAAYSEQCYFDKTKLISLLLFENVGNSAELLQFIKSGHVKCSLLKASTILDKFQILVAANKAILAERNNTMTTKSIWTEVVYNMSCSKNISDSLTKFGISDECQNIMAVVIDDVDKPMCDNLKSIVDGKVIEIAELSRFTNEELIKKLYKVKEPELQMGSLLDAVVSRIATKDLVSF